MTTWGICPDLACQEIEIEKEKQKSNRQAIKIVAERLGVSFNTAKSWVNRNQEVDANAPTQFSKTKQLSETLTVKDLFQLIEQGKKYSTIYADPPWPYQNQATRSATSNHYSVSSIKDICALPVPELTTERAHLHLWTTNAFLFEAKKVMDTWGFEYKSAFVWVKPQMGIGNYWRLAHEFLLLGVKGNLVFKDHAQISWLEIKRGKHSTKPEKLRYIIEKVSPGPYLELFARKASKGWTAWGNEIEKDLFYQSLNESKNT